MKGSSQSNLLILSKSKPFKYGKSAIYSVLYLNARSPIAKRAKVEGFSQPNLLILPKSKPSKNGLSAIYSILCILFYTSTKVFSIFSCNGFKSCLISIRQMISLIKSLTKSSINEPLGLSIHTWGSYTMRGTSSVIVNHRLCRVQERFLVLHVWQPFFLVYPPLPPWSSFWEYPPLWSSFS